MYKKDFILKLRASLTAAVPRLFSRLSVEATEQIFDTVMETIVSETERGDEVRALGFGRFYAKPIHRAGQIVNVKLGFASYDKLDKRMTKAHHDSSDQ